MATPASGSTKTVSVQTNFEVHFQAKRTSKTGNFEKGVQIIWEQDPTAIIDDSFRYQIFCKVAKGMQQAKGFAGGAVVEIMVPSNLSQVELFFQNEKSKLVKFWREPFNNWSLKISKYGEATITEMEPAKEEGKESDKSEYVYQDGIKSLGDGRGEVSFEMGGSVPHQVLLKGYVTDIKISPKLLKFLKR